MEPLPRSTKGQSLVEMLITIGLAALILPAIYSGLLASRQGVLQTQYRITATNLGEQGYQATRILRDADWTQFATLSGQGVFHPEVSGNTWILAPGSELIDSQFTRTVEVTDVYRDSSGAVVESGGVIDPSTKKVTTIVSWPAPLSTAVTDISYLTRLGNLVQTDSSQADFDAGEHTGTSSTNLYGGEVILGSGGSGSWCQPNLSLAYYDLPGQGIATAISATEGHAYTTTGGNASGNSMDSINITTDFPPQVSNGGTYNYYKTYDLYATDTHIYLTSDHPGLVVDIVNPVAPFAQQGYFNGSSGGRGSGVYISGTTGYVTAGTTFYAFDVSTILGPSQSQPELWKLTLAGTGGQLVVVGNYAYITTSSTSQQLQIIDLTTHQVVGSFNAGNGRAGVDVYANITGDRAYLATGFVSGQPDVFALDTTDKAHPQAIGTYSTQGMNPKGIIAVPGNIVIVVGSGGEQYQVINMTNPDTPSRCGGLTNPHGATSVNAVAGVQNPDGRVYAYILTDNAGQEFQIIEGGPGGGLADTGVYTSRIFDPGYQTAFNRIFATADVPAQTSLTFQVAAADQVSGSCDGAAYVYLGPDGTSASFFDPEGGALPMDDDGIGYENPSRCFRYRAYFESYDPSASPVLYDVSVNYSP